jgi:hypothetical protein
MDLSRELKVCYLIERRFLELVQEIMEEKKLKQVQVAPVAFPDRKDATRKFQQIMRKSRLGEPQRISFQDAYFLALSIDETPFGLFVRALEDVRSGLRKGLLTVDESTNRK